LKGGREAFRTRTGVARAFRQTPREGGSRPDTTPFGVASTTIGEPGLWRRIHPETCMVWGSAAASTKERKDP
jgi:hypothetical protein